jgi:hypothetical protein
VNENLSVLQRQNSNQRFEQRGLSRAIWTNHSHARAMRDLKTQVSHDYFFAVAYADVVDFETMRGVRHVVCVLLFQFTMRCGCGGEYSTYLRSFNIRNIFIDV